MKKCTQQTLEIKTDKAREIQELEKILKDIGSYVSDYDNLNAEENKPIY